MPAVTVNATIANGASLSGAVLVGESLMAGIVLPAAWTSANLTMQAATQDDPTNYVNLYDKDGVEVAITAAASRYVVLNPADFAGIWSIKLRSGTSGTPVTQGAERTLAVVILTE